MTKNLQEKLATASKETSKIQVESSRGSKNIDAISVVCTAKNGKRIALSNSLYDRLGLDESADIILLPSEGEIIMAKSIDTDNAIHCSISSKDVAPVIYNSLAVEKIKNGFNLDYSACTSKRFTDITFEDMDGVTFAIIKIQDYEKADKKVAKKHKDEPEDLEAEQEDGSDIAEESEELADEEDILDFDDEAEAEDDELEGDDEFEDDDDFEDDDE